MLIYFLWYKYKFNERNEKKFKEEKEKNKNILKKEKIIISNFTMRY